MIDMIILLTLISLVLGIKIIQQRQIIKGYQNLLISAYDTINGLRKVLDKPKRRKKQTKNTKEQKDI